MAFAFSISLQERETTYDCHWFNKHMCIHIHNCTSTIENSPPMEPQSLTPWANTEPGLILSPHSLSYSQAWLVGHLKMIPLSWQREWSTQHWQHIGHSVGVLITHILLPCVAGAVTSKVGLGTSVSKDLHNIQLEIGNDIIRLIRTVYPVLNSTISLMQFSVPCDCISVFTHLMP